jgi:hypothetical protein
MNEKEKFTLLYEGLKEVVHTYIDTFWKTFTVIVLIMGWVVTSEDAQKFLASVDIKVIAILAVGISGLSHIYSSVTFYNLIQKKFQLLKNLKYVDAEHYDHYQIQPGQYITNLLLNIGLIITLILIIGQVQKPIVVAP